MQNRRLALGSLLLGLATFLPVNANAAQSSGSLTTGIMQVIDGVGTFTGSLTTNSFAVQNGALVAVGTITGTLTSTTGAVLGSLTNAPITIPVNSTTGSCTILTLQTGQINLNVLGLNVVLSPINLVITAQSGPGNLLGNLLCSVAGLLDGNSGLTALATLLNQILAALKV